PGSFSPRKRHLQLADLGESRLGDVPLPGVGSMYQVDFESFFDASPYPQGLLSVPDLTIVTVNNAYSLATGRTAAALVGRPFFEAFPPSRMDPACTNVAALQASLERVIATRRPDTIPFIRFAVDEGEQGPSKERCWSVVHTPLLD